MTGGLWKVNTVEFLLWEQTTRDTIDLKKIYIDVAGDIVSGVLLSQIIFWNLPNQEGKTKLRVNHEGKLWLAKGREDWWQECRLSSKQFDRSIKILEDKDIVITALKKFNGSPTKHIYLNLEVLVKRIEEVLLSETEGKMDITQKVKSNLTKGKNENSSKGKKDIPQKGKSLTETTTKITTETTQISSSEEAEVFKVYEESKNGKITVREKGKLKTFIETYTAELVLKAIDETVLKADKFNLAYVESCLKDWVDLEGYEKSKQAKKGAYGSKNTIQNKQSTFNNFKQRNYDFDDLKKKLLGWDKYEE
jgi:DnaD/phage-associated family protein